MSFHLCRWSQRRGQRGCGRAPQSARKSRARALGARVRDLEQETQALFDTIESEAEAQTDITTERTTIAAATGRPGDVGDPAASPVHPVMSRAFRRHAVRTLRADSTDSSLATASASVAVADGGDGDTNAAEPGEKEKAAVQRCVGNAFDRLGDRCSSRLSGASREREPSGLASETSSRRRRRSSTP